MATIYAVDATPTGVQNAINTAVDGDTVVVPAADVTWATGVTCTKAIKIVGAGAGGFKGSSTTSLSVGAGSKTFVTSASLGFVAGQTVKAFCKYSSSIYMQGIVTSYSGTSLVVDVQSIGGSGTVSFWVLAVLVSGTTITHSAGAAYLVTFTESTVGSIVFTGFKFVQGTGSGEHILVSNNASGKPVLVYDCWFSTNGTMLRSISWDTNQGVVWRCSFDENFTYNADQAIGFKPAGLTSSWTTNSTIGTGDTTGQSNVYVEECYFASLAVGAFDFDDNSRVVCRYNTFDNSALTSHGADTSAYGCRHWEVYNNTWLFDDMGSNTINLDYLFFIRGGTGIIADNIIPNVNSSEWGNKAELKVQVQNLRRNSGPNACWAGGYMAPHQFGQGYNGALFSDPVYIWGNSGGGNYDAPSLEDYSPDECGGGPPITDFVQSGRDYFASTARPSYTKYTYPHPLRATLDSLSPTTSPVVINNTGHVGHGQKKIRSY